MDKKITMIKMGFQKLIHKMKIFIKSLKNKRKKTCLELNFVIKYKNKISKNDSSSFTEK